MSSSQPPSEHHADEASGSEARRSSKPDTEWSIWTNAGLGARPPENAPVACAVWTPEGVQGVGDGELSRLGEAQRGTVHREQILLARITPDAIRHRLKTGRLHHHPGHRDVYVVGRPRLEPLASETAAVLHFQGHAVLSHQTAAHMWGLIDDPPLNVVVTVVGRGAHSKSGLTVHQATELARVDIRRRHRLPVTSPARTAVDCAGELRRLEYESLLAVIRDKKLATESEILDALARRPNVKGAEMIRKLLVQTDGLARTRRVYERRLLGLIRQAQLPAPRANHVVCGLQVDLVWWEHKLVVEFDSVAFHDNRRAFHTDRKRDRILGDAGYRVIRLTARDIDDTPYAVVAWIAAALAQRTALAA